MRTDENGEECPATLGEYRDLCAALGGEDCAAVAWLDAKIAQVPNGRGAHVIAPDSQVRAVLMPLLTMTSEVDETARKGSDHDDG